MAERTTSISINRSDPHAQRASRSSSTRMLATDAFENALADARGLCRRRGLPLSIVMLDFNRAPDATAAPKKPLGEDLACRLASILGSVCGDRDFVSRRSSDRSSRLADRFVIAMPESGSGEARALIDRCRQAMTADPVLVGQRGLDITLTAGIADSTLGFIETQQQLIQRAEMAVEQAKQRGDGQIVVWRDLCRMEPFPQESRRLTRDGVSHWVKHLRQQIRSTCVESTRALVAAVEAKDHYTEAHSLTVAAYAEAVGKRMDMPAQAVETLRDAALLHDVGKIGIPDAILTKPGPLTEEEFVIIKKHPALALDILRHISFLTDERPFILHHHERFDGQGYPHGLTGGQIPIGARILAVTDALDTMLSPRTYKKPYSLEQAKKELIRHAGKQFDPDIVNVTLGWLDDSPGELAQAVDRENRTVSSHPNQEI
ncbi:MAG: HD domain-containing protein [Planctomycetes bacterium]|nr:HD domain-containing protein [Planctomycetota bacterium]